MKYLFINPVSYQYTPAPVTGIPTLLGILHHNNISSEIVDLNLDFINKLLKDDLIVKYFEKMNFLYSSEMNPELHPKLKSAVENSKQNWDIYKRNLSLLKQKSRFIISVLSGDNYYNPLLFRSAQIILRAGLISMYNSLEDTITNSLIDDLEDCRSNCDNPDFEIDISYMLSYFNSEFASLKEYYINELPKIISEDTKCIGISIGHYYQFLPGMLLCYLIKQKYNVHVNIGGSFFNDYYKEMTNLKDLFSVFFDSVSIDDNTKTVLELIEYIDGKRDITEVENLISCQNGQIHINKTHKMNNISDLPFQEFYGYEKNDYLIPKERVFLPIRASYGCYWHKCIFCMCSASDVTFEIKSPEKLVDEIEYLSKKYNTNHFYFWDNSLPPKYLDKMADLLIEKKLNIKYSFYARFEKEFDYKLLKKLKESGCLLIYWGLDSASERVLKYINKGITISNSKRVLKEAKKAKIANIVFNILGHPTETLEDIEKTYDYAKAVRNYVQEFIIVAKCLFVEGSVMQKNREYYKKLILTTPEQREEIKKRVHKLFNKFDGIHSTNYLLYLEKFGPNGCDLRFKIGQILINNPDWVNSKLKKYLYNFLYNIVKI